MNLNFIPSEIIKKKRNGSELTKEEIDFFIQSYTQNTLPDYQMSALLMAIYFRGMTKEETINLTRSMIGSGKSVEFKNFKEFKVDKHSTGGIGDKTSLILGPIVAAAGTPVPMISGRGLGHTGGTLDKLESIPGFNIHLDLDEYIKNVEQHLIAFIGQTAEICPADKKMYSLRDVTATVENINLICASIMSKKIAEGIDGLVLDVKYGHGAFMKTKDEALLLAENLVAIGKGSHKKTTALITNMNQPLGRFAGNALEVFECVEILEGKIHLNTVGRDLYADTRELSLRLSSHMLYLTGKYSSLNQTYEISKEMLNSGKAFSKFQELCLTQGGNLKNLPSASFKKKILAHEDGFLHFTDTEKVGISCIQLKAGRKFKEDSLDYTSGIEFHFKHGDAIKKGDTLFTLYGNDSSLFEDAEKILGDSFRVSLQSGLKEDLIYKVIT